MQASNNALRRSVSSTVSHHSEPLPDAAAPRQYVWADFVKMMAGSGQLFFPMTFFQKFVRTNTFGACVRARPCLPSRMPHEQRALSSALGCVP